MKTLQENKDIDTKLNNNKKTMPVAGFNVHPENINRNGAPVKEWTFRGLYRSELEQILTTSDGKTIPAKQAVAKRLVKMAIDGDIQAIKELNNRIDGLPRGGEVAVQVNFNQTLQNERKEFDI